MKKLFKLFLVLFLFSCSGMITINGNSDDVETLEEYFQFDPDTGEFIEAEEDIVEEYAEDLEQTRDCEDGIGVLDSLRPGLMKIDSSDKVNFYFFNNYSDLVCKLGEKMYNNVIRFRGDTKDIIVSIERRKENGKKIINAKAKEVEKDRYNIRRRKTVKSVRRRNQKAITKKKRS